MAKVCREIEETIEETVWKKVKKYRKERERKCKKKKCKKWCLCCNKWFCWIETFFVLIVTWVAEKVTKLVTKVVCEFVEDVVNVVVGLVGKLLEIAVDVLTLVWDTITFDWGDLAEDLRDLLGDLVDLGTILLDGIKIITRTFTGGYVWEWLREEIDKARLIDFVEDLLAKRFADDPKRLTEIRERLGLPYGDLDLEVRAESIRTYVDSETAIREEPPTLFRLHQQGQIDLYALSEIEPGSILDVADVEATLKTDGALLSKPDLDEYIASSGAGPHFQITALSSGAEATKLDVAEDKFHQMCISLKWTRSRQEVFGAAHITVSSGAGLTDFVENALGRDPNISDFTTLAAAAVFDIVDGGRHPFGFTTGFSRTSAQGLVHRDRKPEAFFKYVLAHECGHYLGLAHPGHDGLDKIMYSPVENGWWSWNLILEFLVWSGEPRFTFDDAKNTWRFVIETAPELLEA